MILFVDGYNLIFAAARKLPGFDIRKTEAARDKLLLLLGQYKTLHSDRIVAYFDGGPEAAHLPRHSFARGVEVVFSDHKSDADQDIKTSVTHANRPAEIRVITSDSAIRNFVRGYGAQVTDSADFLEEIAAELEENALPQDEPPEKYGEGKPDDVEYWQRLFSAGSEDGE